MDFSPELAVAERAARAAGELIRAHYERNDLAVDLKADASPVTQADRDANTAILDILRAEYPADAILSEETPDDPARLTAQRIWIVDPLDGTKDFVNRSGEFSVHVGFAVDGVAVAGAVYQPITQVMFGAAAGQGAWRTDGEKRTRVHAAKTTKLTALRVGTSRAYPNARLVEILDSCGIEMRIAMGASTKLVAIAAGVLDAVINLGSGECEWDSCAPEIIIREAGGAYTDTAGNSFRYNQRDTMHRTGSIASNGACHRALVSALAQHVGS